MLRSGDRISLSSSSRSTTVCCMTWVSLSVGDVRGTAGAGPYQGRGGGGTGITRVRRNFFLPGAPGAPGVARKEWVLRDWRWPMPASDRCGRPIPPTSRYGTTDMSAPTPAPGDDRPREGYYPDPSIPGYVRYWNGTAWVPGTSRPAPKDGEPLSPPPGVPPAVAQPGPPPPRRRRAGPSPPRPG
ncbi:DUF2510 domain-containing protein [Streptomyces misionensis]|uniref:DUF2510 domain-containing protein n=1 Tax=Streptomyces misionensis TaxID=67331 RepID=UPI0037DA3EC6